ncbi:PKD domain-containing protein [Rhodanobacter sp. OK091]|uniref:PKD domain-containing protein n=1 Tax=Rhodanobacter sp. OK091 TaxID=1881037 RepID=UPI000914D99A|nr:PKD domain-containing protein [Rhodanobacter sp. OK091]SHM38797.1 serine protease [Rhodanobacter sp. OK091]
MKHKFLLSTLAACTLLGIAAAPVSASETNPYSPANGHAYRHGVLPTRDVLNKMNHWKAQHALTSQTAATGIETLSYGGALDSVGVMSGKVKVYVVYYGTQWGTRSTNSSGDSVFTGDSSGAAAKAEEMFKGIGTNSELWSADLTQWCDGPNVTSGATSCPSNANFVPYQSGGTLAGVWYDNTKASPATATQAQLAAEAVSAAAHFGNTAAGSNRYTYYIIMSPHGTNPDSYQGSYCAWHDYTTSSYGDIAYSNQPYNIDSGQGCGVNFVNSGSAGTLDGWTMTLGHEWHEMMSDTYPAGGWTNHTGNATYNGQENSDECAWIAAGSPGGAANITFATGTFTEQASWSNDTNACAISHPIVGGGTGGGTPVANFTDTISGLTVNFTDSSTDTGGTISSHAWTFGDGGTSTATSPSHTYAAAGTYSVTETVTDSVSGATNSKTASVTVSGGGGGSSQLLGNTGFESGTASPWSMSSGVLCSNSTCSGEVAHAGTWFAWLDGYGSAHTDTVSQSVAIPSGKTSATLSYALHIDTAETGSTAYDKLNVQVLNSSGTVLATLATYSNVNAASGYTVHTANLAAYIGQTVTIKFTGTEDSSLQTSFVLDDVTLTVQ